MKKLTVVRNKSTGQTLIILPKALTELYDIDEKTELFLEPKGKDEFVLRIRR